MRLKGVAFLLTLTVLAPLHSLGHDHAPPQAPLRVADSEIQEGRPGSHCWVTWAENDEAVLECTDRTWGWPEVARVPDPALSIRLFKDARPASLSIVAWASVDPQDGPVGPAETIGASLTGGEGWWDASFELLVPCRDYYLKLSAIWPDEQGTHLPQDASWTFHVVWRPEIGLPPLKDATCL